MIPEVNVALTSAATAGVRQTLATSTILGEAHIGDGNQAI
jgi:hypothetical protein